MSIQWRSGVVRVHVVGTFENTPTLGYPVGLLLPAVIVLTTPDRERSSSFKHTSVLNKLIFTQCFRRTISDYCCVENSVEKMKNIFNFFSTKNSTNTSVTIMCKFCARLGSYVLRNIQCVQCSSRHHDQNHKQSCINLIFFVVSNAPCHPGLNTCTSFIHHVRWHARLWRNYNDNCFK